MATPEEVIDGAVPRQPITAFDLPALAKSKELPKHESNDQAFYAASINPGEEGFKQTYNQAKFDLETSGESHHVTNEMVTWKDEQNSDNDQIIKSIIADPSIPVKQKAVIVNHYNQGGFISNNLRDKYIQKTAAIDNADTTEDRNMQELLVNGIQRNYQANKESQDILNDWGASLDSSTTDIATGIARDFIPGVWSGSNAASANATAKYFGFSDKETMRNTVMAFIAGGSSNKRISEILNNTLDPQKKKEFILHLLDSAKQLPGSDYNQYEVIKEQILDPSTSFAGETFFNFIAAADAIGLGGVLKNPVSWFKGLYTFRDDALSKAVMSKVKPLPPPARIEPTMIKQAEATQAAKASSVEPTGTNNGIPSEPNNAEAGILLDALPAEVHVRAVQPKVAPMSPMGLTAMANPKQARELSKAAIMDDEIAAAAGTSKGEIIGSNLLPKLDDDFVKRNPDIANDITEMDKKMSETFGESNFDPFLVNVTERADDKAKTFKAFAEVNGAHYQQSNSSFRESLGNIEGRARYGRNADFGYSSIDDAQRAEEQIKQSFVSTEDQTFATKIVNDNDQWYVEMDWKRSYDPFSARMFGVNSADASFMGVSVSPISRSAVAKHIIPNTMRLDEWVTKGAFHATVQADRVGEKFLSIVKNEIKATPHKLELQKATEWTLENQKWMDGGELSAMFPNLSNKEMKSLERSYTFYKRLTDYHYLWANRKHTNDLVKDGFDRAIYDATGDIKGYASQVDSLPVGTKHVWDFEAGTATQVEGLTEGRTLVKLHDPVRQSDGVYRYGVVSGTHKLDLLPERTLQRVEGYIARKNIEPWYIKATPKSLKVDGNSINDINELEKFSKVIGAGKSQKEAEEFARKLQLENPNDLVQVKPERGDIGDSILTDYKVYKEMTDYGRKRGQRLPTLYGQARLEDPLVAQVKAIQSSVRLNAWGNYQEIFQKNFLGSFGDFLPRGEFPNVLTDIKLKNNPTVSDLERFQVAQRLFEQYANQQYKINYGDEVWKQTLHKIADVVEDSRLGGFSEEIRDIANKGNLGLKSVKSLANTLFLNLNSLAQWIVQPQAILEYAVMSGRFREQMHMIPGLLVNMLSRASDVKPYKGVMSKLARNISTEKTEFDAIADAIYKSGLPQSVDMNMMLHGGLDEANKALALQGGKKVMDDIGRTIAYIPDTASKIGKAVGYSPAQLTADIGSWLFAKGRWEKLNPGKNWNTPEGIAQITTDAWDIAGSMHTRAGAMPYQDGMVSLFFQFQAILHKQFFQVFSSKSLKKAEGELIDPKAKIAAARVAIYGAYGVPGYALVDSLFSEFTDSDTQAQFQRWKGGVLDLVTNTTIDLLLSDSNDAPSDLALSARIGPIPETVPYYDMVSSLVKFAGGNQKSDARMPFTNAIGSVFESVNDYVSLFRVGQLDTEDALKLAIQEAAELSSGYKNYGKAVMAMEMGDKVDKMGNKLGLNLSYTDGIAQMFGVVTKQELALYKMRETKQEREDFINQRSTEIHQQLLKSRTKLGEPEFLEFRRRLQVLNSFTPEEMRSEIFEKVIRMDAQSFREKGDSNIMYIIQNAKQKNDKHIEEMVGYLKASDDPRSQQALKRLIDNNIIKP